MTAFEMDMLCASQHINTNNFIKREQESIDILNTFFKMVKTPYLALSWGKQSTCLAHMVWKIRPKTLMIFTRSWESYWLHNFEEVINDFTSKYPIKWIDNYCDNVSWNTYTWKQTRDLGKNDVQEMGKHVPDWDGVIMGLSKEESKARRITTSLDTCGINGVFKYTNGKYRATPIQNWSNYDIGAYILKYDIPMLNEYKEFGLKSRTTARMTRMYIDNNGLFNLKIRNFEAYNKIVTRFPELKCK